MRISVALCTYNGEAFLKEQLESIGSQSLRVTQVVISDDASGDGTVDIINEFLSRAPFEVILLTNDRNLGIQENFSRAIDRCDGDIIFLSDQDDVWMPNKVEEIVELFSKDSSIGAVFTDAILIDNNGVKLGTLFDSLNFSKHEQEMFTRGRALEVLLKKSVATGATMAFRSNLKQFILPIPSQWMHDAWIASVSSLLSSVVPLEKKLIYYRLHGRNVIGIRQGGIAERLAISKRRGQDYYLTRAAAYEKLLRIAMMTGDKYCSRLIEEKISHMKKRGETYKSFSARLKNPFIELLKGNYARYSNGIRSFIKDFLSRG